MTVMAKERVIQFGEGNFLRGFCDYFLHKLNESGLWEGKVVVVQPLEQGMCDQLSSQNCEYNLYLRGIENNAVVNEKTHIDVISRCVNPYQEFDAYMELAANPDIRYIISNTTEAGIEYLGSERLSDRPAKSYPAKLTQLLYRRFKLGLEGFVLMPCELIDQNGDRLKECVLEYARLWGLSSEFIRFVEEENDFCNTLVDRIVTGYPVKEAETLFQELGVRDSCLVTAEIFHLWVIEGDYEDKLPFQRAGYNIVWAGDVTPYKKRKVRILNGGHTSMAPGAHLCGLETVGQCMKDETVSAFLKKCMFDEIIPTLGNTQADIDFGKAVLERFSNPFIEHQLLSIVLNSLSKFAVRVLPTILEYKEKYGAYPPALTFSLAALIAFYRTGAARDGEEIISFMKSASVDEILRREDYWGRDLSELSEPVNRGCGMIQALGIREACRQVSAQKEA